MTKSSSSLQTKIGHKLGTTMWDNWAVTIGLVVAFRLYLYWYTAIPNYRAWAIAVTPVVCVSYAWLRVEHPDQAERLKSTVIRAVRFVVDVIKSLARFTTRIGDGGPIDHERLATWREVRSERANRSYSQRTDPKRSATLRIEQDVWATWGCPGTVIDYDRNDVDGVRTWTVSLPDDFVVAQAVRILRDKVSRGADVPSSNVGVDEAGNSGRVTVTVRREAMKLLPDLLSHPLLAGGGPQRSVKDGARVGRTYDGEWIVSLADGDHTFAGAATNQGKSVFITNILAEAALMPDAEVWLVDPKRVDYAAWRNVVARYANTSEAIAQLVDDLLAEMRRRLDWLEANGRRKWAPTAENPQIVVLIDEVADIDDAIQLKLKQLALLCRAAGIKLVLATQRPTRDNINQSLLAQLVERVAFHCATAANLSYVLGEWTPDELGSMRPNDDFLRRPGDALIKTQLRGWHLGRTFYISDDEIGAVIQRLGASPHAHGGTMGGNHGGTGAPMENVVHKGGGADGMGEEGIAAVVPPAELFVRPERQAMIWTTVATINAVEHRPATKTETAERLRLAPRTINVDLKELVSGGLLKWAHESDGGRRTGLIAQDPS